jgi:hypothetical protein
MTPSRAPADSQPEDTQRDTIPAPPPSGPTLVAGDDDPIPSRVAPRRSDTVPAPTELQEPSPDDEPPTDPTPIRAVDATT